MMLVTLQQARDQIRSDENYDDADLTLKIEAASEAVIDYIGDAAKEFIAEDGSVIADKVPKRVMQATLITVGYLYRERDGSQEFKVNSQYDYGYGYALPQAATSLLFSIRKPVAI